MLSNFRGFLCSQFPSLSYTYLCKGNVNVINPFDPVKEGDYSSQGDVKTLFSPTYDKLFWGFIL